MRTLTRPAAHVIGQLKPERVRQASHRVLQLPAPRRERSALLTLLSRRQSQCEFAVEPLAPEDAPLDRIYVADGRYTRHLPVWRGEVFGAACAGVVAQNVYLFCAEQNLNTVVRAWFDAGALTQALESSDRSNGCC